MSTPAVEKFLDQAGSSLVLPAAGDEPVEPGRRDRVLVSCADRGALRSLVAPAGVRSAVVGLHLAGGPVPVTMVPKPEWPALQGIHARSAGEGWLTVLRFERPVEVAEVVAEAGRQSVWGDAVGNRGLWVGGVDAVSEKVPADVLPGGMAAMVVSEVTGRTPAGLGSPAGPLSLGPLDERVLNPIGFVAAVPGSADVVALSSLDLRDGPCEGLVASVRGAAGVRIDRSDAGDARVVAGLAMAGVPLVPDAAGGLSPALAGLLGSSVSVALAAPVDLSDALAREEHSVVLRRAALDTFSTRAWRAAVASSVGVRVALQPAVSVVLATRRADMLDFALRQVAKQRGVEALELVLAPHGFAVDEGRVRAALPAAVALTVVARPEETPFGDVLAAAASAASGDVALKMDDDDWYAPDVVADLLRARDYSGAEMVGMPAEMHYVAERDLTVKRGHPSEGYARFVAGGTMMVDRGLLREVGSFRSVRKYVDAQLIAAVTAAGAAIYRTHGLGYVLRRNASGHTWEVDLDYLLDPVRVERTWEGFRPSRLLEHDPVERP
ncbi:glycosyltransferase [Nocardioides psychrotolerans]|uniref:glycosyltransferase n=1 Tax=Nocardioides psychrotolerans TaxID=1005945 RepID=UPI003137B952